MDRSDILLSIGNKGTEMAPSKIYEYMSTGKPIIHVYSEENDPCIEQLVKYGNALLIKEGNDSRDLIVEFINSRKNIDTSDVFKRFISSTPSYTVDLIIS